MLLFAYRFETDPIEVMSLIFDFTLLKRVLFLFACLTFQIENQMLQSVLKHNMTSDLPTTGTFTDSFSSNFSHSEINTTAALVQNGLCSCFCLVCLLIRHATKKNITSTKLTRQPEGRLRNGRLKSSCQAATQTTQVAYNAIYVTYGQSISTYYKQNK